MTSGQLLWAPKEALLQGPGFLWDQEPSFNPALHSIRPREAMPGGRGSLMGLLGSVGHWSHDPWSMIRSHIAMVHVAREPLQVVGWGG